MKRVRLPALLLRCPPVLLLGSLLIASSCRLYLGDLQVVVECDSIPSELTFAQGNASWDEVEYTWGVFIDVDNNPATGDSAGFEAWIGVRKYGDYTAPYNASVEQEIRSDAQLLCFEQGDWWRLQKCQLFKSGDTLVFFASSGWHELSGLDGDSRIRIQTGYASPGGWVIDTSPDAQVRDGATDASGDVAFPFIDVVGGQVILPPA